MPSMLIGVSNEGGITHWNAQIEEFTGISQEKILNKSIDEVLPELEGINNLIHQAIIHSSIEKKEKFTFHYTKAKSKLEGSS